MSMFWNCLIEEMYVEFSLLWELYLGYHVSSCASSVNISVTSKLDSALANHYSSMDISNFCINWMLRSQLLYNPPSWKHVDSWLLLLHFYVESSFWIRERKSCFFCSFFCLSLRSYTLDGVLLSYFFSPSPLPPARSPFCRGCIL